MQYEGLACPRAHVEEGRLRHDRLGGTIGVWILPVVLLARFSSRCTPMMSILAAPSFRAKLASSSPIFTTASLPPWPPRTTIVPPGTTTCRSSLSARSGEVTRSGFDQRLSEPITNSPAPRRFACWSPRLTSTRSLLPQAEFGARCQLVVARREGGPGPFTGAGAHALAFDVGHDGRRVHLGRRRWLGLRWRLWKRRPCRCRLRGSRPP